MQIPQKKYETFFINQRQKLYLPNYLEAGNTVLMVLCVRLQVVDVDVGQAREQQLQLLLVEDRDQPGMQEFTSGSEDSTNNLPPRDDVVESLEECGQLFPDGASHPLLTDEPDVVGLVHVCH